MNVKESKAPEYIEFPYDVFLMLRLEFLALCHDELEAKIMRIIEKAISEEWERIYRERCASTPKNQEVKMPDEVWAAIPIRYFMDRLLGTVQSETTLKDALKSLINTKKFVMRKDRSGKYEAPLYTLNREPITKFFETLPSDPRKLDILSLMKQPRKKKAVSGDQLLTPSNNDPIKPDGYNSRYHQLLTPSTPIIDPMTELAGDQLLTPTNMYYLDDNLDDKDMYTDVPSEIGTPSPSPFSLLLESWRTGSHEEQQATLQVLIDAGIIPPVNENDNHSHSSEKVETSSQSQNSTSLPEPSLLPTQQAENGPCPTKPINDSSEQGKPLVDPSTPLKSASSSKEEKADAPIPLKKPRKPSVTAQEKEIQVKLQDWINKERGYRLHGRAPKEQIFQEQTAVQTLAHMVYLMEVEHNEEDGCTREELGYARAHIRKYDSYWSKPENRDRIGAYAILQKLAEIIAKRRKQQNPKAAVEEPSTFIPKAASVSFPGYNHQIIEDDDEELVYAGPKRKRA